MCLISGCLLGRNFDCGGGKEGVGSVLVGRFVVVEAVVSEEVFQSAKK